MMRRSPLASGQGHPISITYYGYGPHSSHGIDVEMFILEKGSSSPEVVGGKHVTACRLRQTSRFEDMYARTSSSNRPHMRLAIEVTKNKGWKHRTCGEPCLQVPISSMVNLPFCK